MSFIRSHNVIIDPQHIFQLYPMFYMLRSLLIIVRMMKTGFGFTVYSLDKINIHTTENILLAFGSFVLNQLTFSLFFIDSR